MGPDVDTRVSLADEFFEEIDVLVFPSQPAGAVKALKGTCQEGQVFFLTNTFSNIFLILISGASYM